MTKEILIRKSLVIVGGGPAGLAAAVAATDAGLKDVLIIERDDRLGGILNQCIHNGFGLHRFKEELTGPEYAARFIEEAEKRSIEYKLGTIVLDISVDEDETKLVTIMNSEEGTRIIKADAVILAMGCRERPRGALGIPGFRPQGIYTAGTAQRLINIDGVMPGKEVVILGSGDIGLIMARRMTLEGAHVAAVFELMPYSNGLNRNIVQCLEDYGIPLYLSHTIADIKGKDKLEGVVVAEVDGYTPIPGTEKFYPCDTLLLSCGLIPENELSRECGIDINPLTNGPLVDEKLATDIDGVFACGNVLHVHDLVDYVSAEAKLAGESAAEYVLLDKEVLKDSTLEENFNFIAGNGVRYTVPNTFHKNGNVDIHIKLRVTGVYKNKFIVVKSGDKELMRRKTMVLIPSEMQDVLIKENVLRESDGDITILIED